MDAKAPRLDVVDLLRGFVIALMVLDHTRAYFSPASSGCRALRQQSSVQ
jgi:uncharacterized membrane protein